MVKRRSTKRSFAEIDRGPLGAAIFTARKRVGLTQAQLATAIDRDRPWLSDLETAKLTFITDEDARNLAAHLPIESTELDSLRRGTGSRRRRSMQVGAWYPPVGFCPECRRPREPAAHFCGGCGITLPSDVVCSACGHPNASASAFCTQCGGHLGQVSAPL